MSENQKLGPDEAFCWSCGTVVVKQAVVCPKCGQEFPATNLKVKFVSWTVTGILIIVAAIIARIGFSMFVGNVAMIIGIVVGVVIAIIGILGILGKVSTVGADKRKHQDAASAEDSK